jgi:adenine-specific DNA methylase
MAVYIKYLLPKQNENHKSERRKLKPQERETKKTARAFQAAPSAGKENYKNPLFVFLCGARRRDAQAVKKTNEEKVFFLFSGACKAADCNENTCGKYMSLKQRLFRGKDREISNVYVMVTTTSSRVSI